MVARASARASPAAAQARLRAVQLEAKGDLVGAMAAYEEAVALDPADPDLLKALARLASRLDLHDLAVKLWRHLAAAEPRGVETGAGLAQALIAAGRFPDAIDVLKAGLAADPAEPRLWTTLGLCLTYAGRAVEALTFFDEAVRLAPDLAGGRYNRGLAWADLGRLDEAEADFRGALALSRSGSERATIEFSLATLALARGELAAGWALYERRLSPDWPRSVDFAGAGPRLLPGQAVAGRSVLVLAEQGLGDEVMFASAAPDLLEEIGPDGRLVMAVDARLVDLFQRSFPQAEVSAHATPRVGVRPRRQPRTPPAGRIDGWIPLASLAQRYRGEIAAFPRAPYLTADPARVAHWAAWLGEGRPAVGLTWRRGKAAGESQRRVPPLTDWVVVLQTPGVRFVNLQYGDCAEDLARLAQMSGVEILQPPGLDIKDHIDDLAALCTALDAVAGIQNATSVLAGACGTPVVFVAGADSWFQLGQAEPPWFARVRFCPAQSFADWSPALAAAADGVRRLLGV